MIPKFFQKEKNNGNESGLNNRLKIWRALERGENTGQ